MAVFNGPAVVSVSYASPQPPGSNGHGRPRCGQPRLRIYSRPAAQYGSAQHRRPQGRRPGTPSAHGSTAGAGLPTAKSARRGPSRRGPPSRASPVPPGNPDLRAAASRNVACEPGARRRFPAVVDFPGYTPAQLIAILQALAAEAGLTLTPTPLQSPHRPGRHRERPHHGQCAPRRPTAHPGHHQPGPPRHYRSEPPDPAILATINAADIPEHLPPP
jgi:hypothetical protein